MATHDERETRKVNVCIVGLGTMAQKYHLPILSGFRDVQISIVVDTNAKRRELVARRWSIKRTSGDLAEISDNCSLDAVYVCTPNFSHGKIVEDALKRDMHVFCEKPFGTSSDKASDLAKMAEKKGLILTVGYNRRLDRNLERAASAVRGMRLGRIVQAHGDFFLVGPYVGYRPKSDWLFDERSGGALYDIGSHLLDSMLYALADRIEWVLARSANALCSETVDNVAGLFKTERDIVGTFNVGWQAAKDYLNPSIQVHGTAGSVLVDSSGFKEIHGSYGPIEESVNHLRSAYKVVSRSVGFYRRHIDETYVKEDRDFIDSIKGTRRPSVPIDDAIHVLEVLEAARKSIQKEEPCRVKCHVDVRSEKSRTRARDHE